jgi:hypothetical protein
MTMSHRGAIYQVAVRNPRSVSRGVVVAELDGVAQPVAQGRAQVRLSEDHDAHVILVTLG